MSLILADGGDELHAAPPPSTVSVWPVTKAAPGLVRKSIAPMMSAVSPSRPRGVLRIIRSRSADESVAESSVARNPGATALGFQHAYPQMAVGDGGVGSPVDE